MSSDEYFASGQSLERPIYEAVEAHLASLGPLIVEFLTVGIQFKRVRTFAELRPMKARVRLWMLQSRALDSVRIARTEQLTGARRAYAVDLRSAADFDDEVREWLTESYFASPE
jgi:Domain of unknown function (DUF5655)